MFLFFGLAGGYNASPESQESKAPPNKDPSTWSVEDVVWFIRDADPQALGPHADVFRKHVSFSSTFRTNDDKLNFSVILTRACCAFLRR